MRLAGHRATPLAILLLVSVLAAPASVRAQAETARVQVDAVIVEPLSQTVPVLGRFVARQSGPVAALVGGPVAEVLVEVGDRVEKGDVLVRLATDISLGTRNLRDAELREKTAALETARAQERAASLEMDRLENLKKSPAFSPARYEDKAAELARYRSEVAEAEAAVVRAEANLALAEINLMRAEIRAPYNGVVVDLEATEGAYVITGARVASVVNDEDMEIEADVPAERLSGLVPGRGVRVTMDNGRNVMAVVRSVIPTENALTRTRPVRFTARLAGGDSLRLATDQSVTVMIPVAEMREVVTVHKDAVIASGSGYTVYVVVGGKAASRPVDLGAALGVRFEVRAGLEPGDIVVTRGNERLRPGQPVSYDSADSSAGDG